MSKKLFNLTFIFSLFIAGFTSNAQTVTFSEVFTGSSSNKCTEWGTFQAALNPGSYTSVTMSGSFDVTGITCTDPTIVNALADAIKNVTDYISPSSGGHVWSTCARYQSEVWIDPPSLCSGSNCPSPGYILRPCIGASVWGGVNSNTCGSIAQTMTLEFVDGPPCPGPAPTFVTNVLSSTATLNWTPVTGTTGYEYVLDMNSANPTATPTSTPNTTIPVNSLMPNTTYYLHVRSLCTTGNKSPWELATFTTLPPCSKPSGFNVTNLQTTSATINWNPLVSANNWNYVVDLSPSDPPTITGATTVLVPTDNITGLVENTKYYVHIRANCTGETSDWSLDSFLTPIPCRAPVLKTNYINTDEAVVYWEAVPTATSYEYAITKSATVPVIGTKIEATSVLLSALNDGVTYYVHVRNTCNSVDIISQSPWSTISFKTFPLGVEDVNNMPFAVSAHPNPVSDILTVDITGKLAKGATLTIVDVTGKVLINTLVNDHNTDVNMSALPSGNYILKYSDGNHDQVLKVNKK
jgi:hypothetical protein